MAGGNVWVIYKGVPAVLAGRLEDFDDTTGKMSAADLTQFDTITAIVRKTATSVPVELECTVDPADDFRLLCEVGEAAAAAFAVGEYRLQFRRTKAGFHPIYSPLDRLAARSYGRFIVQQSPV